MIATPALYFFDSALEPPIDLLGLAGELLQQPSFEDIDCWWKQEECFAFWEHFAESLCSLHIDLEERHSIFLLSVFDRVF